MNPKSGLTIALALLGGISNAAAQQMITDNWATPYLASEARNNPCLFSAVCPTVWPSEQEPMTVGRAVRHEAPLPRCPLQRPLSEGQADEKCSP
jgi:hypothetical protein